MSKHCRRTNHRLMKSHLGAGVLTVDKGSRRLLAASTSTLVATTGKHPWKYSFIAPASASTRGNCQGNLFLSIPAPWHHVQWGTSADIQIFEAMLLPLYIRQHPKSKKKKEEKRPSGLKPIIRTWPFCHEKENRNAKRRFHAQSPRVCITEGSNVGSIMLRQSLPPGGCSGGYRLT